MLVQGFPRNPGQRRRACRQQGVDERQTGNAVGRARRASVEAKPAHPQQRSAHHGQGQAVRREGFFAVANALAHHVGTYQPGHTCVDMHHRATGKIKRTVFAQQAAAPDHVGNRDVAEGEPEHAKQQHGAELHALGKRTHNQRHGDGGKGGLKSHEHIFGNGRQGRRQGVGRDAFEEQAVEAAKEMTFPAKRQAVAVNRPQQRDQREDHKHLHQHRQHVLGAGQTTVEQRQTGDDHQDHQQRGGQHPGGVAAVKFGHGNSADAQYCSRGGAGRRLRHHGCTAEQQAQAQHQGSK